jgi:nucleoside-diphosphate-sugar epimerase
MKALILGGTRFIGARVARRLHEAGADVTVFHRGQSHHPDLPAVRHVHSPLATYPITEFPPEITRSTWDVVVHMVAMGETDARCAARTFAGRVGRLVLVSSCDVYRAYGRVTGLEPGLPDPTPLDEAAPLRESRFPYRGKEAEIGGVARDYDKILAEQAVMETADLPWTVLRLAKVYGPEENADLATVYGFARVPRWRWTHGYVENVAAAITTAALHRAAVDRVFNVGEAVTPTIGERLAALPTSSGMVPAPPPFDFAQDLAVDTTRLRRNLGFSDVVDEARAMRALAAGTAA